jgi:succinate dehydrogenase / fumarate reductase, flavoprotein subunit
MHGANRLGGNSLAETVVFGRRAGAAAARYAQDLPAQHRSNTVIKAGHEDLDQLIRPGTELARPLQRAVRDMMWESCGVVRSQPRLLEGLTKLAELRDASLSLDVRPSAEGYQDLALALDVRAALAAAEATLRGAIERRESRGGHQRSDYPELDPELAVNFVIGLNEDGQQMIMPRPVPPAPSELAGWLTNQPLDSSGRLLE